ncbi:MAG: hypothetical protein CMF12_02395 [Idiomarina sp.]|uniref:hypothetical protein n=1 Tax=Idiomarina sp. TaxID=1874361 RepID=UPI000C53E0E2|nr:hypothetical protein [Idiomarina sp.]MAK70905.1 hypothetical protein [Idiomarinaceae bacterium]MBT41353.1 hypothetical protein [Idiomarina sp.]HAD47922.1 hypothetical protein [Idiomarina sp.]|tara:strand:+ start:282 stop:1025 length:744 start_codon:yes stop_codon:yes gene_type:complete
MLTLHSILLYLHISAGVVAMLLFWIPITTRKGGLNHRRFGKAYVATMYTVSISAIVMCVMVLSAPEFFKAAWYERSTDPVQLTRNINGFWTLLLVLSLLTYNAVNQAMLALKTKRDRGIARQLHHVIAPVALLGSSLVLFAFTLNGIGNSVLGYVFSVFGVISAVQVMHYAFAKQVATNRWLLEHLSSMCGSGIAVYTAFFAFGARHVLAELGQWQLVFWIAPGILGGIAIHFWTRKYAKQASKVTV